MPEAVTALEQVRQFWPGDVLGAVVADDEGNRAVGVAYPADDRGEDAGQFRCDEQQTFLIRLDGTTCSNGTSSPVSASR